MKKLCLILGDQLSDHLHALRKLEAEDEILMAEVDSEASYVQHHPQKIALIFSAMRHFAIHLRKKGHRVHYIKLDDPKNQGNLLSQMRALSRETQIFHWLITEPGEWRLKLQFLELAQESTFTVDLLEDDRFVVSHEAFAQFLSGRKQARMEHFYRKVRQQTGLLMNQDKPEGGRWNYDQDNRKAFDGGAVPKRLRFEQDEITAEVLELVKSKFSHHFGDLDHFNWPVTRQQALMGLDYFITNYLGCFGDFQDALVKGEDQLFHSLLSSSINIGLLDPLEVCQAAEQAYQEHRAPLNAVEGFIRQIIGWREYVRGLYWAYMPQYAQLNTLEAKEPLPAFYWNEAQTGMHCMSEAVRNTREHAYAHHIQRLMVTGNFALIYGCDVEEVCAWYLAVYIDAFEWVELPNTLGMALYGDDGVMASKPYCSSGKYINKMSNYCKDCIYSVQKAEGDEACPFNFLYWDFLIRHHDRFKQNPRMALTLKHILKMSPEKREQIISDSKQLRTRIQHTGSDVPESLKAKHLAKQKHEQAVSNQGTLF